MIPNFSSASDSEEAATKASSSSNGEGVSSTFASVDVAVDATDVVSSVVAVLLSVGVFATTDSSAVSVAVAESSAFVSSFGVAGVGED